MASLSNDARCSKLVVRSGSVLELITRELIQSTDRSTLCVARLAGEWLECAVRVRILGSDEDDGVDDETLIGLSD